jgi:hypothetical protein
MGEGVEMGTAAVGVAGVGIAVAAGLPRGAVGSGMGVIVTGAGISGVAPFTLVAFRILMAGGGAAVTGTANNRMMREKAILDA